MILASATPIFTSEGRTHFVALSIPLIVVVVHVVVVVVSVTSSSFHGCLPRGVPALVVVVISVVDSAARPFNARERTKMAEMSLPARCHRI